ncbi:hypothetical protein [Brassicibacter mesophilus]|uniref:hypothetical protein n=1 Tax=Brassicibacter mesophilus TaxID=745119 RepID=UPI003D2486F5
MNYFGIICFVWALIGIGSRIIMGVMGEKWNNWELNSAYASEKPKILNVIGVIGYLIVIFTWYMVIISSIEYSWIIAALVSVTVIKISTILFNYKAFRRFVSDMLNNEKKMFQLNLGVVIYSIILIFMGIFLY